MTLSALARSYDHVVLDLDGCVWVGDEPTPRAVDAVEALRTGGKGVAFVTNDVRGSGEDVVRKLWALGFCPSVGAGVTLGGAQQFWLAEHRQGSTAFVIGSPAVERHVADAGLKVRNGTEFATRADVVIVAWHEGFDYDELRTAVQAVRRGADLIGAARDASFPMPDGPWPGTGALLAAIEYATGSTATTVGKPDAEIFRTALDRLGDGRTLVVGDRIDADLAGAHAAQLDAAIVLTGEATRAQAEAAQDPAPVAIAETLADLVLEDGRSPGS